MLARELAAARPPDVELHAMARRELDVMNSGAIAAALDDVRPDVVMNASGYTAVDRAESDRAAAFAINAAAVGTLGAESARRRLTVVHFGTDYVFDGSAHRPYREDDPPAPINSYGESKLEGERALLSSGATALIIRAQWLLGPGRFSFSRVMWDRAAKRQPTRVVNDQRGRPTLAKDVARATWTLLQSRAVGVFHVANAGEGTWHEVAAEIFARQGVPELLTPCSTDELQRPARRPKYSVLDTTKAERLLGGPLSMWRDALGRLLDSMPNREALPHP